MDACEGKPIFQGAVADFASSVAILLDIDEVPELQDRIELLEQALDCLDSTHLPDAKKKVAGSKLGSTIFSFNAGQKIVQRGRVALGSTRASNDLLEPMFKNFELIVASVTKMNELLPSRDADAQQLLETLNATRQQWGRMKEVPDMFKEVCFQCALISLMEAVRITVHTSALPTSHVSIRPSARAPALGSRSREDVTKTNVSQCI